MVVKNRGIFSKLIGPGPLGSGGHSHTSFSNGRFQALETSFHIDVFTCISYESLLVYIKKGLLLFFMPAIPNFVALKAVLNIDEGLRAYANYPP